MYTKSQQETAATAPRPGLLHRLGRTSIRGGLVLLLLCLPVPFAATAQTMIKSIEGKVLASGSDPLPGSIIYLQDTKTNVIKTLIATADGSYHFGQLPADTDYQIWAEFKGKKSKNHLISSFDTKRDVTYNFHIDNK